MSAKLITASAGRFLRNPNFPSFEEKNSFSRKDCFQNSVKILEDPKSGKTLTLVGTLNCSNLLAERTKKLIESTKPDSVLVQTSKDWFSQVNDIFGRRKPETSEEIKSILGGASQDLKYIDNNLRNLIFKSQLYPFLFLCGTYLGLGEKKLSPFQPGLESYFVSDYAKSNKIDLIFSGKMLNSSTISLLERVRGIHLIPFIIKALRIDVEGTYKRERVSQERMLSLHGVKDYSEIIDDKLINWWIACFNRLAPEQKRIFVDCEDERLFKEIHKNMKGKNLFALVNHWNLPGIERHWKVATQTSEEKDFINPIGDFDININQEQNLINDTLRRMKSKLAKSEPASTNDYLYFYNKSHFEGERERHVFFEGYDDPELEHGLYNGENDKVKDLPYKQKTHH